ncbi:DNA sulfur modification protein DndB [Streptomyces sp. NPDC015408]|uniref:DNA sulfur modification protein DndB n=1 Tax=Streptomyces sp. NPDC015408 TaxID=3364956 RepID=UPI0036FC9221
MGDSDESIKEMLAGKDVRPTWFETVAFRSVIGDMVAFNFMQQLPSLVELRARQESGVIIRKDYDLDDDEYGNRPVDPKHVERIATGLYNRPDTPVQQIQLAIAEDTDGEPTFHWERFSQLSPGVELGRFKLYQGVPMHIENGQHTLDALARTWQRVKGATYGRDAEVQEVLSQAAAPIQILVQNDRDEVTRLFVVAGQTKPIPAALMTALDQSSYANRLGTQVGRQARLLRDEPDRLVYLRTAAKEETLYTTAHMRGFATAMLIGFRDRTPDARENNVIKALEAQAEAADDGNANLNDVLDDVVAQIVKITDYAYDRMPGWKDLRRSSEGEGLTPKRFRSEYLHGSPAGLYVVGAALGAARFCGISLERTVDALAELPWERAAGKVRKVEGVERKVHPLFDNTLVRFERQVAVDGDIIWTPTTAGGARTNYEAATSAVLKTLAKNDPAFHDMTLVPALVHLGLRSANRRGRPRKTAVE